MNVKSRFERDVREHQMQALRNDGAYRHLRFGRTGSTAYGFELVTWPGHLSFTGDMGTYVFASRTDMFEFFRPSDAGKWAAINLPYWAEKVLACDTTSGIKAFSQAKFEAFVQDDLDAYIEANDLSDEEADDLRARVREEVLDSSERDDHGVNAIQSAVEFRHADNEVFPDFFEIDAEEYSFRFTWCCYALGWAIAKYDHELPTS